MKPNPNSEFVQGYADALLGIYNPPSSRQINPNGLILHETAHIVVIATGLKRRSKNSKTKDMVQIWVLVKQVNPIQAYRQGLDQFNCGNCPARWSLGGDCYVNLGQAPFKIWQCYNRGGYAKATNLNAFKERFIRFGAYGDPVHMPFPLIQEIARHSAGWTGYTHQWRNPLLQAYKTYLMASADSIEEQFQATRQGWRTFRVDSSNPSRGRAKVVRKAWKLSDECYCPASKELNRVSNCHDCRLCGGTSVRAKNIVIRLH